MLDTIKAAVYLELTRPEERGHAWSELGKGPGNPAIRQFDADERFCLAVRHLQQEEMYVAALPGRCCACGKHRYGRALGNGFGALPGCSTRGRIAGRESVSAVRVRCRLAVRRKPEPRADREWNVAAGSIPGIGDETRARTRQSDCRRLVDRKDGAAFICFCRTERGDVGERTSSVSECAGEHQNLQPLSHEYLRSEGREIDNSNR